VRRSGENVLASLKSETAIIYWLKENVREIGRNCRGNLGYVREFES